MGSINHLTKFIPNAASLTDQLRPLLREENQKKKKKNVNLLVKKFEWREQHSLIFEEMKKAVARIAQINYYNLLKDTRVKCDASHSGLGQPWSKRQTRKNGYRLHSHHVILIRKKSSITQMSSSCLQ